MIGALVAVAACAGLLGIESPSEPGAMGDASDESVPEGAAGDALPPEDAPPVGADGDEGDNAADGSGLPTLGVPCGTERCTGEAVCCYRSMPPTPLGCKTRSDCTAQGGNSTASCDGPEDCLSGQACCVDTAPGGGGFSTRCDFLERCAGVTACHPLMATCDCKASACVPYTTCGLHC
jgi:hypothetical protein